MSFNSWEAGTRGNLTIEEQIPRCSNMALIPEGFPSANIASIEVCQKYLAEKRESATANNKYQANKVADLKEVEK